MLPSTFQHDLLGLFAVANNFPAIGPFLTLSQGVPAGQVRRVIRITTFATRLTQMLGHVGMTVLIKVMGLFTLAIGVQFIATGISTILGQITLRV